MKAAHSLIVNNARRQHFFLPSIKRNNYPFSPTFVSWMSFSSNNDAKLSYKSGASVTIQNEKEKSSQTGVIIEQRGGGWFSIQLSDGSIVKRRRNDIVSVNQIHESTDAVSQPKTENAPSSKIETALEPPLPTMPEIINIDELLNANKSGMDPSLTLPSNEILQYRHFLAHQKWVVFTDLHCSPATLSTTLAILDMVHETARSRNAGILFLGDWWHHRGSLRIDCLNAVLESLSHWTVPLIAIPGNHDQVTLDGREHGLTPLRNAFRLRDVSGADGESVNGVAVFTSPTVFGGALFVPHIRCVTSLESVLRSSLAREATAVFAHADVTGAMMNDLIVSKGGVSPSVFPPCIPIYTGHFHKPHVISAPRSDVTIRYVGSPYEVSLAEAGQEKSLLILDRDRDWECVEEVSLGRVNNVPRHWKLGSRKEFLQWDDATSVKKGDRVVVSVEEEDQNDNVIGAFEEKVKTMRRQGVNIQLREVKNEVSSAGTENETSLGHVPAVEVEDMSPETVLCSFLESQIQKGSMSKATAEELRIAGLEILESVDDDEVKAIGETGRIKGVVNDFILDSVTLKGFGSFKEEAHYPLDDRGLVLLRGINDDVGYDSNGSGKSTLAISILWGLTGSIDPRPVQDAKVSDIVNDNSKSAIVSLRGRLNNTPFTITRTKTATKSNLSFHFADTDLTRQSVKETQDAIYSTLGIGGAPLISRAVFHGQHDMDGLLEATDMGLKEELSHVADTRLWQDLVGAVRKRGRTCKGRVDELDGMLSIREGDVTILQKKVLSAEERVQIAKIEMERGIEEFENEMKRLDEIDGSRDDDLLSSGDDLQTCQESLDKAAAELKALENMMAQLSEEDEILQQLQADLNFHSLAVEKAKMDIQEIKRQYDRWENAASSAKANFHHISSKWRSFIETNVIENDREGLRCPTCDQTIHTNEDHSHHRHALTTTMQNEISAAQHTLDQAQTQFIQATENLRSSENNLTPLLSRLANLQEEFTTAVNEQKQRTAKVSDDLATARGHHVTQTMALSRAAEQLRRRAARDGARVAAEAKVVRFREGWEAERRTMQGLEDELRLMHEGVESLKLEKEDVRKKWKLMTGLADVFGAKGVQTFVLENTLHALQKISQSYLDQLSLSSQRLTLTLSPSDQRINRTAYTLNPTDGTYTPRPLSSLSGGQWRRCSLSLALAYSELISRRGGMRCPLLVLDEPLTHLDAAGRASVGNLLKQMVSNRNNGVGDGGMWGTVLIILQDLAAEELLESFDRVDEVIKQNGHSFVKIDNKNPKLAP